jgi:ribosomal protein L40E
MGKFPEADKRLFHRIFICKNCKSKIRAPILKVLAGKVACRKCAAKTLRVKKKK